MRPLKHLVGDAFSFAHFFIRASGHPRFFGPSHYKLCRQHVLTAQDEYRLVVGRLAERPFSACSHLALNFCRRHYLVFPLIELKQSVLYIAPSILVTGKKVWSAGVADAVVHLRATGEVVPDEWLTHTSPVGWEHIGLSGDFLWDRAAALPVGRRSLNLARRRDAA